MATRTPDLYRINVTTISFTDDSWHSLGKLDVSHRISSNRDAIGAKVIPTTNTCTTLVRTVKIFAIELLIAKCVALDDWLGQTRQCNLQIVWSSGYKNVVSGVRPNLFPTAQEGQ